MNSSIIPTYNLSRGDELSQPFRFLQLERSDASYNPSEPHRHNYFEVFYFQHGGGAHDVDFRNYDIRDHSIHFVMPGQVHQVRRNPDSHGTILLFTAEFFALGSAEVDPSFLHRAMARPALYPSESERFHFSDMLQMIGHEYESNRPHSEQLIQSYLNIFLIHAVRLFEEREPVPSDRRAEHELIQKLRLLIEEHFTTIHAPHTYAEMLCISQNHLNATVRDALGCTLSDLLHERILLEAKRLLYHTQASVKEIAFQLNYDDPSYFTRFFRRHTGLSPNEFREQAREKHQ